MHKPTTYTSVIALCAITALTVIFPNSYAGSFGPRTVAIDERGAQTAAAQPIVGPVINPDEEVKIVPKPAELRARIEPYTTPLIIKPTN